MSQAPFSQAPRHYSLKEPASNLLLEGTFLGSGSAVIAVTGSLVSNLGGIDASMFQVVSGVITEAGGNPTAENVALVAILPAVGSC